MKTWNFSGIFFLAPYLWWVSLDPVATAQDLPDLPSEPPASATPLDPLPPLEVEPQPELLPPGRRDPVRKVVIIRDDVSWYFDTFADKVKSELEAVAEGSYEIRFEDFNAKGDPRRLSEGLVAAVGDETVDLVIAAGYLATNAAMTLDEAVRKKPVLGGAVEFSELMEKAITPEGTSNIPNYSFITNPQRIAADIAALRDLSGQRSIYALVDRNLLQDEGRLVEVNQRKDLLEKQLGVRIFLIPAGGPGNPLGSLPPSAEAVYVSVLPGIAPGEREALFARLAERGVVTLSMVGLPDVRLGAIAGLAPDNGNAIARRAALNAHQILLGIDTEILPVYLPVEDRLIINRESAETAEWYPTYEIALTAEFLDSGNNEEGEEINLVKAMCLAAEGNADVRIQKEQEVISRFTLSQAESFRRPSVSINVEQSFTDYTDRINPILTPDHATVGTYGVELRQALFNDTIRSNIGSALESVASEKLNTASERLDAMESAGIAFLNYLAARALWQIQKENLRLTENNLQLARLRVNIGATEPSEVFRWEQDAASSRALVFQSEADVSNAQIEMNRILGQPREKNWRFTDIELKDEETFFMDDVLNRYIVRADDAERFGDFLRLVSVPASPELASFDFALSAFGIELERIERSFFLPEISGLIRYRRSGQGTERFDFTTQGETLAAFSFSYSLYEGGFREPERGEQEALIRQLAAQRERALQIIEQRALTAFNGLFAEHPNIRLSRRALAAAEQNFESVREKYSKGAASILDILDAQSALLRQRQQEAIAVYSYLQQVVSMQRSIAWFEHCRSPSEKRQWEAMLDTYMACEKLVMPCSAMPDPNKKAIEHRAESVVGRAAPCPLPKGKPGVTAKPVRQVSGESHPRATEPVVAIPVASPDSEAVASPVKPRKGLIQRVFQTR